jgi:hypothetical protein
MISDKRRRLNDTGILSVMDSYETHAYSRPMNKLKEISVLSHKKKREDLGLVVLGSYLAS